MMREDEGTRRESTEPWVSLYDAIEQRIREHQIARARAARELRDRLRKREGP